MLLGQAITLVESRRAEHQALAQGIVEACMPHTGRSLRIGVTGSPGVGKSSFIEMLGIRLTNEFGHKLAVLAIDPSSRVTRGSILGDKTRMEKLAIDPHAFIRPSPAGTSLGGVAARTRETMLLCEAAGFDIVFIETVGVGQSEVAVHGMVDLFLLLLLPGAGDELQGIKRGIVEMADLVAINKADGDRVELAKVAKREYSRALHLFPPKASGWTPKVVTCSSITGDGMEEVWSLIEKYRLLTTANSWLEMNRKAQSKNWFYEVLEHGLRQMFFQKENVRKQLEVYEKQVVGGQISVLRAAQDILKLINGE